MESLKRQLALIINKYEKLDIDTPDYRFLKGAVSDVSWLTRLVCVIEKVENLEKVFNVSKEINSTKSDQRLSEAFAEFDTADRFVNTKFFGDYEKLTYIPRDKNKRRPDFVAEKMGAFTPIEVKLLSPSDLDESKFFQKFLDKINKHALPQLKSYYDDCKFESSFIFVWTHEPVRLQNLEYYDLRQWLESKVERQEFGVTIMFMQYGLGMWDFPLPPKANPRLAANGRTV